MKDEGEIKKVEVTPHEAPVTESVGVRHCLTPTPSHAPILLITALPITALPTPYLPTPPSPHLPISLLSQSYRLLVSFP